MATQAEVIQRVGEDLALVGIGQALESQDEARIANALTQVYARLKEKGLATWVSTGDIPDKLAHDFELMMEARLLTSYSVPDARYQRIMGEAGPNGDLSLKRLAALAIPEHDPTEDAVDF